VQITYFLCFVLEGILPEILFLVVLYREFSILFVRNLMLKKGIAMGARMGGKIKTVVYIATGAAALLTTSVIRLASALPESWAGYLPKAYNFFSMAAVILFAISVLLSVVSFADYVKVYRGAGKASG
jgi:CDP-diacylglycerol--glycerol-3-phosphate 3-phosphatidyltransferase